MDKLKSSAKLTDIARLANCSIATVSNAINGQGRLSEKKREEIMKLCKELNYLPNSAGRNLRMQRTDAIGLMFSPSFAKLFGNIFYARIMEGLADTLNEEGFDIMLAHDLGEKMVPRIVRQGRVDALMLLGAFEEGTLKQITDCPLPVCLVDSHQAKLSVNSITSDGASGATQVVDYLFEMGHSNVLMTAYGFPNYNIGERIKGFKAALRKRGIKKPEAHVMNKFDHNEEILEWLLQRLKEPDAPTALFAINDTMAIELIEGLTEAGHRVPEDVSIVGFDDDPISMTVTPHLTTVAVEKRNMGAGGARMIVEQLKDSSVEPRHEILPTRLVVRDSVARI